MTAATKQDDSVDAIEDFNEVELELAALPASAHDRMRVAAIRAARSLGVEEELTEALNSRKNPST